MLATYVRVSAHSAGLASDELAVAWLLATILGFYIHAFGFFMFEIHSNILFLVIFEFGFGVPWIN